MSFIGIPDPWIWGSYVACIVTVVFCCVYGFLKGRGDEEEEGEEDGN